MFESITSVHNPRVKHVVRLRESSHRTRQARFVVEGRREVSRALETRWPLETLYFCPECFTHEGAHAVVETADRAGVECVLLAKKAFAKASLREGPDGLLAVARHTERALAGLQLSAQPLLLLAQAMEKPGNLGALLRTADAAGVEALIVCDPVGDLYNPNAIRASQGSFFHVPFVTCSSAEAREWLVARGIRAVATSPAAPTVLWETDLTRAAAIIVGTESTGLTPDWLAAPVEQVRLPMQGLADSLNVNTAAAICLFEAVRQRAAQPRGSAREAN